jgi:ribosomal protein L11 methyltransferase
VGCGSGVLAIAGSRLGFEPVVALDHDPTALEATRRNARTNGVALECRLADGLSGPLPLADVVVANISAEATERLLPHVDTRVVVASGYLEQDAPATTGFRQARRLTQGGWAADLFRREE